MTVEQAPPPPGLVYILGWWREVSTAPLMSAVVLTARPRAQTGVAHIADDAGNVMYGVGVSAATDPEGRALLTLVWVEGAVYDVEFGGVKGTLRCDDWDEGSTVPFTGIRGLPGGDGIADPLTWDTVIAGLNDRIASQVPPVVATAVEDYLTAHPPEVVSVAGRTGAVTLTKADVGLGSVDNTSDADKPISTATATAITALAPKVNPALTATTPAPVLTTVTTPALSAWTLTGSATYSAGSITVGPAAGGLSTTIPVTNDTVYQIDLTTSASSGGDVTVTLGAASATYPAAGITSVTVTATETGTRTLTISGATWSATITGVTVKALTRLSPAATIGAAEVRAWSTNTAVGTSAHRSLTTGPSNTAAGAYAQFSLTTGSNNAALGVSAQYSLTTGINNAAVGTYAQGSLTTGINNAAVGMSAQYAPAGVTANATTTGNRQTSIGTEAGQSVSTQLSDITTVGYRATAGADYGTAIGSGANAAHLRSVALGSTAATTAPDQVMVGPRDVEISSAGRGVILLSPGGTRYRVGVTDAGTLTVTAV